MDYRNCLVQKNEKLFSRYQRGIKMTQFMAPLFISRWRIIIITTIKRFIKWKVKLLNNRAYLPLLTGSRAMKRNLQNTFYSLIELNISVFIKVKYITIYNPSSNKIKYFDLIKSINIFSIFFLHVFLNTSIKFMLNLWNTVPSVWNLFKHTSVEAC